MDGSVARMAATGRPIRGLPVTLERLVIAYPSHIKACATSVPLTLVRRPSHSRSFVKHIPQPEPAADYQRAAVDEWTRLSLSSLQHPGHEAVAMQRENGRLNEASLVLSLALNEAEAAHHAGGDAV